MDPIPDITAQKYLNPGRPDTEVSGFTKYLIIELKGPSLLCRDQEITTNS
jgi:hypothetical protein